MLQTLQTDHRFFEPILQSLERDVEEQQTFIAQIIQAARPAIAKTKELNVYMDSKVIRRFFHWYSVELFQLTEFTGEWICNSVEKTLYQIDTGLVQPIQSEGLPKYEEWIAISIRALHGLHDRTA